MALALGIGWGLSGPLYADWPQLGRRGESERVLALSARNGETLWTYEYPAPLPREILTRVMFTNALRIDGHVYASSGDLGAVPMVAVDVRTGAVAWRDRSFGRLNMVRVGDRVLVLDEKGTLGLVTLSPQGLTVHSRCSSGTT